MDQLVDFCQLLYPQRCCHDFLIHQRLQPDCIQTIVVKTLGYGIIFGSTLVKLPQIIKLCAARSGAGVSLFSVLLELMALTFTSSYSLANQFPISAWGESLFLQLMTLIVAFLIILYDRDSRRAYGFMVTYLLVAYVLMSGLLPLKILWGFQVLNVPLIISSKLVQAWLNLRNSHTGNLSFITVFLIFLGGVARIFTSIRETGDTVIILGYVLSSIVNTVLVFQLLFYWNKTILFLQKNKAKKTQ